MWNDAAAAQAVMRDRNRLAAQVEGVQKLEADVADALGLIELAEAEGGVALVAVAPMRNALLLLFAFAVLKTFWPKRSVTLPTVMPAQAAPSPDVIAAIRAENDELRRRLTAIEEALSREPARG